ncbi:MAG: hypothetical protein U1F04_08075 [Burkholderiaceae bacterium]
MTLLAERGEKPDALLMSRERYTAHETISQGAVLLDGSENASVQYVRAVVARFLATPSWVTSAGARDWWSTWPIAPLRHACGTRTQSGSFTSTGQTIPRAPSRWT